MNQSKLQISDNLKEGATIARKYRVDKLLGFGGMGIVVAAQHLQLDRRVAIKCLLPEVLDNPEAVARFTREAQAAARISSEHVVRIYDVGNLDDGAPYMVMEYLEGGDLNDWLSQKGVLSTEQAVEFVLQVCVAIAEAHSLGIIHRDLKPANIFCIQCPDGTLSVKVLDFGISKLERTPLTGAGSDITRTTTLVGSPYYMSPEHLRSARDVDARTDIWSLGVILYQLLTGHVPFNGESLPDLAVRIVQDPTPSVREARPDVPQELDAVIRMCLEKDRDRRYRNVAELAVALVRFGPRRARASAERVRGIIQSAGLSSSALALPPSSDNRTEDVTEPPAAAWGHTARPAVISKKWITLSAASVALVLAAVVLKWSAVRETTIGSSTPSAVIAMSAKVANPGENASIQTDTSEVAATVDPTNRVIALPVPEASAAAAQESSVAATSSESEKLTKSKSAAAVASTLARTPGKAPPGAKVNCNPSYTLDAQGRKHFRPECF